MKRYTLIIFSCVILFVIIQPISISLKTDIILKNNPRLAGGWLEDIDGVKILHINGSYYNMGYQQGYLLRNETQANIRAFLHWIDERGFTYKELVEMWASMKPYLPQCYTDELQGLADGSGLSFENISVYNVGFYLIVNCGSFSAWGPATIDGQLYHARSHDFPINLKDPETDTYLVETQVLIVREPDGCFASVSPTEAGFASVSDGFNTNEITAGMLSSWSDDETLQGINVGFRIRMVLDHSSTIEEAIDILTSNKTLGYNFIASDGKVPVAYAIETTANLSYAGKWNNSSESNSPFWSIDSVVRRSNMFVDNQTAATQRKFYRPNIFPLLFILIGLNQMSGTTVSAAGTWLHYKAISKGIEQYWGNLDLNKTFDVLRDIYLGKTDLRFLLLQKLGSYQTPYQWVICPKNGDFVISFATRDKNAFENPVHFFNLYNLLED